MTQEQMIELANRAVACKGWRWMTGMRTINGGRVFAVDEDGSCRLDFGAEEVPFWCTPQTMAKMSPDLADPATLGCFLWLVRDLSGLYTELTFEPGYMLTEVTNLVEALDLVKFPEENP